MEIKPIEDGWELAFAGAFDRRDFHVREELGKWVLDEFDSAVKDSEDAHVSTTEHDSFEEAVKAAFDIVSRLS